MVGLTLVVVLSIYQLTQHISRFPLYKAGPDITVVGFYVGKKSLDQATEAPGFEPDL